MARLTFKNLAFTLAFALLLTSCSSNKKTSQEQSVFQDGSTKTVKTSEGNHYIAIAVPLTGPYKELGNSILEGATIAVDEFNQTAPSNHKIGTLIIDDGGLVTEALARADIVIAQKVLGVVGHLNSEVSIEAARKYSKAGIVMISPASTNPKLTELVDLKGFVFRTIGTDRQMGSVAADYVISKPEFNKIAVLYNDRAYGISVATEFARKLVKDKSKELVLYQTIPVRTSDHKATADRVVRSEANLVFFIGEYNDAGYLLNAIKAKKPQIQFLGSEGIYHQEFLNLAKANAEGSLIIGGAPPSVKVQNKYKSLYKKPSYGYVGTSYEATTLLLKAIKESNYRDQRSIAKKFSQSKLFDPNGDLIEPNFSIYKVVNGKFQAE